ncbi:MAG: hypothetical protein LBR91_03530 [Puniceicoccales bacterium]|jgi:hypothetical protein|nr:hypothetical protein [Puniceicoccales bacterium]
MSNINSSSTAARTNVEIENVPVYRTGSTGDSRRVLNSKAKKITVYGVEELGSLGSSLRLRVLNDVRLEVTYDHNNKSMSFYLITHKIAKESISKIVRESS